MKEGRKKGREGGVKGMKEGRKKERENITLREKDTI